MLKNTFFYDLETTGLETSTACILEISCVNFLTGDSIYHTYINPSDKQPITNSNIHGIDETKLSENNAIELNDALLGLVNAITSYYRDAGDICAIAHNNHGYDQLVLEREFQRSNINMQTSWLFIDSLPYIKKCFPDLGKTSGTKLSYTLENVYRNATKNTSTIDFHSAVVDTRVLRDTLFKLLDYHNDQNDMMHILYKYSRPSSSSGEIFETSVNRLHGYSQKLGLDKKKILVIGQFIEIYIKYGPHSIDLYLKNTLKIYSPWIRSTLAQQIIHIGYMQEMRIQNSEKLI